MNIVILASIGSENLGDELILKNEIQLLRQEFWEDVNFRIASYNPKKPFFQDKYTQYFEYFPIAIRDPQNILRNIKNLWAFFINIIWSDIVVIWWGGIIYDSEKQSNNSPLNQWFFRANIARFFRKKLYFYAVWVDIKKEENFKKLGKIFRKAWRVTVRDVKSQEQLDNVWIKSELVDDPVMYESKKQGKILWTYNSRKFHVQDLKRYDFAWKNVWLALRSWYFLKKNEGEKILIGKLCEYIESKWGRIVFLPHSFHSSDSIANDYAFMKEFLVEWREIKENMQEVYEFYKKDSWNWGFDEKIILTMRLHSIILSYVYGVDQIALSYSQKTDEVLKKLKN